MMGRNQRMSAFLLMSFMLMSVAVLAQEMTCPEIVQAALDATREHCITTGRNEACYGNVKLEATPQSGVDNFTFSAPGDIVAVSDIQQLTLSSMVEDAGEWGVALLQLQATLPDSVPGQNVMFVLFGDVEMTNAVESGDTLNPMQAFYFNSGIGDAPCAEAPDSGILVQTPEGAAQIDFSVNGVDISLGSTVYLQAQPSNQMMTSVLEGSATLTSDGESVVVPAGSQSHVLLDEEGQADGPPSQPQPYDLAQMEVLPIQLLPIEITIAAPMSVDGSILLNEGLWTWIPGTPSDEGCEAGVLDFVLNDFTPAAPFLLPGGEFIWSTFYVAAYGETPPPEAVFSSPATNTYTMDMTFPQFSWHYEVRVIDPDHMEGEFISNAPDCAIVIPFTIEQESAAGDIVPTSGEWEAVWVPPTISCDNFNGGNLTWDMSFYDSFRLPEGEFSLFLLYDAIMNLDLSDQATNSSPEPNHYIMDTSQTFGEIHFEVQVIDSDHMEGDYQLINGNCAFEFSFQMERVGD